MIWILVATISLTDMWEAIIDTVQAIADDFLSVVVQEISEGFFGVFVTMFFVTFDSTLIFMLFLFLFLFAFYWKYIHGVAG